MLWTEMRRFATLNLIYLAFVAGSALSSVHIDHEGSHHEACIGSEISAACHADVPHEHEATHAGQESLFEHTFENGNYEHSSVFMAPIFVGIATFDTTAPILFRERLLCRLRPTESAVQFSQLASSPHSSRAPPIV
jgi:hypothetical protein